MFEINVTLTIPGLPEAINNLAHAVSGKAPQGATATQQPVSAPAPAPQMVAAPVNPTPAPAQTAPAAPSAPVPSNPAPAQTVTIDALSRAGAALCEQGKMGQLLALLNKYGVQAVTQLKDKPADLLNAFAAELRALGAAI